MNWIIQLWMNRMNNDGIIEWHQPLVSNNHVAKWRRNRSCTISAANCNLRLRIRPWHLFDWSTRSSSRRPAWETRKHPSPRPSKYDSGLSLSFLEQHKRRRRRQERKRETAGSTSMMATSVSANQKRNEITKEAACSRKRIWKDCARQKSPRVVREPADLWKKLKNFNAMGMIRVNRIFQLFPAFFSILKINECALFKKFMLITLFNN